MNDNVDSVVGWLPGWYAARLHALPKTVPIGTNRLDTAKALCGAFVYRDAPTDWAQRRVNKGVPRCKHCERMLLEAQRSASGSARSDVSCTRLFGI